MQVNVINENSVEVTIDPPQTIVVEVDQGKSGRGITGISYQQEGQYYYLVVSYSDGTSEQIGPLVITGAAASLLGGTAGAIAYQTAPDTTGFLTLGTQNQVLVAGSTSPQYTSSITGVTVNNSQIGNATPSTGAFTSLSASGAFALTGDQIQISEGGTGQTTANAAFNALSPSQTGNAGKYLKTDGTNTAWDQLDISTADITGTLGIANGGTGATNAANARTNLNAASQSTTISAGTGLSGGGNLSANRTIAIANTGVIAASYGSASQTLTATVNAQGQLTAVSATPIAITNTQVSGLGTMSTQNSNAVTITGGSITGITDLAVADGGTGASDSASARTNLGAAASGANSDITSLSGITGAIGTADYVAFDTTYTTTLAAGQLGWDGNNTLGLGMAGGNVVQKIGEDQFYYIKASSAITKGQVVMFTGSVGASGVVTGAPATGVTDGSYIMGIAAETIALNGFGLVQFEGTLKGVDTSAFTDGAILWYNPAVTGGLTATQPSAPNVKVQMAAVINAGGGGSGSVLIRVTAGSVLGGTDSNVQFSTLANGNIIQYDSALGYWKNVAPSSLAVTTFSGGTTGLTPATATAGAVTLGGTLAIANGGTGQTTANAAFNALAPSQTGNAGKYLTTDGTNTSWATNPLGTVTSVSGTGTVSGITLSGTVTTSGSLTLGGSLDLSAYNGAGAFTTLSASNNVTLSGGTANGVAYLNGSKVLTTGSALTFDGTTFNAPNSVITSSSSSAALRITQTGSGNALLVEDSANPDSTPFVVDSGGNVIAGYTTVVGTQNYAALSTTPAIQNHGTTASVSSNGLFNWASSATTTASLIFSKSISGTVGTRGALTASGSTLGAVTFAGDDGTNFIPSAAIVAVVDATPGTNDMPGRLVFSTTADGASSPTERLRISANGLSTFGSQAATGAALSTTAPAKIYTGTGTYTDSSTAASGTVSHGTINALDNPAIAASNTTVTYTNASTLYIDGAPTAGTNVTITNPYSLFVNSGTVWFGGNVTGTDPVVQQSDIGSGPNEIPLNQYLGALAYEDTETPALDVGTGITGGTGTICKANGGLMGGIYQMTVLIDLTGLNSGGTAGDIIGVNGTANPCYIARLPAMTVLGGRMTCLETPAGGDTDIDLYSAAEGTGVEDQAITALTETEIINAGAQTRGTVTYFSADPAANAYFYLVGQGTANATYTAGRFLIEVFGVL